MSTNWGGIKRSVIDVVVMFTVCAFSLSTLVYVAEGDAARVYRDFYRSAAYAQGQQLQTVLEAFLRRDLPLSQFAGFGGLTQPLLEGASTVSSVKVVDERGKELFISNKATLASPSAAKGPEGDDAVRNAPAKNSGDQIVIPLNGKFETVGNLILQTNPGLAVARVISGFWPTWGLVLICSVGFALLTFVTRRITWERKRGWTALAFVASFILVAGVVTSTLLNLYTDGADAKGKALLTSLSGRLDDVTEYKLDFDQFDGLDQLFADYRLSNPDISAIGLVIDRLSKVHSDPHQINLPWTSPTDSFEHVADISEKDSFHVTKIIIAVEKGVVYRQITDAARNMLALFVASALFAYFSMSVARALQEAREGKVQGHAKISSFGLGLIKPVFFLATFIETLNYSFLPQYVQSAALASGVPPGFISLPFIVFYLCFALSLLPAERMERQYGPHKLIWFGLILVASGLMILTGQFGFASVVVARATSGVGQALVFIGVQSYILQATTAIDRTRGASVIVIGFQAGMMSGMAIGSLLVSQLGARGVFELGAAIAVVTAIYTWAAVPRIEMSLTHQAAGRAHVWRNIVLTLRDAQFLETIWFIGMPAKAVLTGVILFALPLLLVKQGYRQEDIGQITMIYGAGVIAASTWVSARASRRSGVTGGLLVLGAFCSGAGLLLISSIGWRWSGFDIGQVLPTTLTIVAGATTVGVGHGLINAPVITQVSESRISNQLGVGPVAATYRLLERAGHTAGPMIVGQVVVLAGSGPLALGWIGSALIILGMFFAMSLRTGKNKRLEPTTA